MSLVSSAYLLAKAREATQKNFNPAHIRPSGVGTCLREQFYRIMNALYPEEPEYQPQEPDGKAGLEGVAQLGHVIEAGLVQAWAEHYQGEIKCQFNLSSPDILNIDGTPVTAHPDIWVPELKTDVEVKSVSISSRNYLPVDYHVDQLLLRLLWWHKYHFLKPSGQPAGQLVYFFRETFVDPETNRPVIFHFQPSDDKYHVIAEETGEMVRSYPRAYMESLHERLVKLRDSLDIGIPPARGNDVPHSPPCYIASQHYTAVCPWRKNCWSNWIKEDDDGVFIDDPQLAKYICLLETLNAEKKALNQEAREISKSVKDIQLLLDAYFDLFGPRIATQTHVISRTQVNVAEKIVPATSYYRYKIQAQGGPNDEARDQTAGEGLPAWS